MGCAIIRNPLPHLIAISLGHPGTRSSKVRRQWIWVAAIRSTGNTGEFFDHRCIVIVAGLQGFQYWLLPGPAQRSGRDGLADAGSRPRNDHGCSSSAASRPHAATMRAIAWQILATCPPLQIYGGIVYTNLPKGRIHTPASSAA